MVGGAIVDQKLTLHAPSVMGTSNPGRASTSLGGVARNVAENLARLGVDVAFLGAVGRDALGDELIARTSALGVDFTHVLRTDAPTSTYTAVLDPSGELVIAVVAMDRAGELSGDFLRARRLVLQGARVLVADGNSSEDTLRTLVDIAGERGIPVVLDPVSVPKAVKVRSVLRTRRSIHLVTPNREELEVLVERTVRESDLPSAANALHELGVERVWVRLGARGGFLSVEGEASWLPAFPTRVVDVTGAGDASLAGYLHALLLGASPEDAARSGHAAASLTLESEHTVSPLLSPRALRERLQGATS
ncbi:pseudouridine kinase [Deinococcus yavapaiensis KR-236]|uniref:Pseudouridine kinase n=1 Tax=Deinococcus yavapaiensis KR-236 TaxID=694435 RepID=A0A318S8H6_9DEIO|nr:pseudouridine kinase [Deinococcus yavapaiensis KR-236]